MLAGLCEGGDCDVREEKRQEGRGVERVRKQLFNEW